MKLKLHRNLRALIYHGFSPLHKRIANSSERTFQAQYVRLCIHSLLVTSAASFLLHSHIYAQSLNIPVHPFTSQIANFTSLECGATILNPALYAYSREYKSCAQFRASQLYQISGLYLYELAIDIPRIRYTAVARSLKWGPYQKIEWLNSYGFKIHQIGMGVVMSFHKDLFPEPYLNIQSLSFSAGSVLPLNKTLSIAAVSEQLLSFSIQKRRSTQESEWIGRRKMSVASNWQLSKRVSLSGGIRLEPSFPLQSEFSLEWLVIEELQFQFSYRTPPVWIYQKLHFKLHSLGIGMASAWHQDLGTSVSLQLVMFKWR